MINLIERRRLLNEFVNKKMFKGTESKLNQIQKKRLTEKRLDEREFGQKERVQNMMKSMNKIFKQKLGNDEVC